MEEISLKELNKDKKVMKATDNAGIQVNIRDAKTKATKGIENKTGKKKK